MNELGTIGYVGPTVRGLTLEKVHTETEWVSGNQVRLILDGARPLMASERVWALSSS